MSLTLSLPSFFVFSYAKLCFEYNVLGVKMKFNWDTDVPVGVKGLNRLE